MYKDGTCQSLENFLNSRKSDCIPIIKEENHQMLNVACFNALDKKVMLTYFLRNKQTGIMEFVYFLLDDETLTKTGHIHKIKIARSESTLSAFTVVEGNMFPSLMTICKLIYFTSNRFQKLPFGHCKLISVDKFEKKNEFSGGNHKFISIHSR